MVDTAKGGVKKVQLTVPEIKEAIAKYLTNNENSVLICDNAHRYPVKLRYWLEEVVKNGSVLMFATHPPRKEIFLLIPRIEMKSLQTSDMRSLMLEEASNLGVKVDTSKLAELEERAVGNPHLAKRVIQEEPLGLAQEEAGNHVNYIGGTPFFIAALSLVLDLLAWAWETRDCILWVVSQWC